MSTYRNIRFEVANDIAVMALARPDRKNAFDIPTREEMADAIGKVKADASIRAFILAGDGGDFCAGGDIRAMSQGGIDAESGRTRMRTMHNGWLADLIEMDRPVIAAVDGVAFGAGFSLALTADFIIATPRARFAMSFIRIGLVPDAGAFYTLPRAVGPQRAKELMMSARTVHADEAQRLGIVMEIVEPDQLMTRAQAIAASFREASPAAVALIKGALERTPGGDLNGALHYEANAQGVAFSTQYHRDAAARFLAKKPLRFTWPEGGS